jgi:hypothetical protein
MPDGLSINSNGLKDETLDTLNIQPFDGDEPYTHGEGHRCRQRLYALQLTERVVSLEA